MESGTYMHDLKSENHGRNENSRFSLFSQFKSTELIHCHGCINELQCNRTCKQNCKKSNWIYFAKCQNKYWSFSDVVPDSGFAMFSSVFFLTGMRLSLEQLNRKSVSPETIKKVTQLVNTYGFRYPKREQEGNESCTAPVLYCLASFKEFTYHSCKCDIKRIMFPPRHKALRCITNKKN